MSRVRKIRSLGALGASLMACSGLVVAANPAAAAPVVLSHKTTISASYTSVAEVEVVQRATLSLRPTADSQNLEGVTFDGGAGLAALVLAPQDVTSTSRIFTAVRLPAASNRALRAVALGPNVCFDCTVEPGRYRLYVVTQAPVSITLTLGGLAGSSSVSPTTRVAGAVHGLEREHRYESPEIGTQGALWGGGFYPQVRSNFSVIFDTFWFHGPQEPFQQNPPANKPLLQVGAAGMCFYGRSLPREVNFAPGCPGGSYRGGGTTQRALDNYRYLQWGQLVGVATGDFAAGGYAAHTGVREPGVAGFWLDIAP